MKVFPVQFSRSVMSDSLRPHGQQNARPPFPSPAPGVYSNSCPLSPWCHPTISSSALLLPSIFPSIMVISIEVGFASGGQRIGASASVLLMNIKNFFPFRLTSVISLQSKELSRVLSNKAVQKHWFFSVQPSLWSIYHIHTWLLEKPSLWLYRPLLAK